MDGVTLLEEARTAGLIVRSIGRSLEIRGPRRAEAIAKRLLAQKPVVKAALELASLPDPPPGASPDDLPADWWEQWVERVAIMVEDGKVPLDDAEVKALADVLGQMKEAGFHFRDT